MSTLTLPYDLVNDQTADAQVLQSNYVALENFLNNNVVHRDGSNGIDSGELALPGPPSLTNSAATKGYVDGIIPVGVVVPYAGATAPTGWLLCQGQLVSKDTYPLLWALLGDTYGTSTATQFYLPDLQSVFVAGKGTVGWSNALGETGGDKDAVVVTHNHTMPQHKHTMPQHSHNAGTLATAQSGAHNHGLNEWAYMAAAISGSTLDLFDGGTGYNFTTDTFVTHDGHTHNITGATASVDPGDTNNADPGDTNNAGESATNKNLPPYITLNYMIRMG